MVKCSVAAALASIREACKDVERELWNARKAHIALFSWSRQLLYGMGCCECGLYTKTGDTLHFLLPLKLKLYLSRYAYHLSSSSPPRSLFPSLPLLLITILR